jgi:hypothetical protein
MADGTFLASFEQFILETGAQTYPGSFSGEFPLFILATEGLAGNAGIVDASFQGFQLETSGASGGVGTADLTMALFSLLADQSVGVADLVMPFFILEAGGDGGIGVDYVAVMNILNFAVSEYQNFNFNSYCAMGDIYLGADSRGIFQLYGDKDDGEEIELEIEKTGMDFGSALEKRPVHLAIGLYSQGDFKIEMIADEEAQVYVEICPPSSNIRTFKFEPGKGFHGRYLGFNIKNLQGVDMALTQIIMDIEVLSRKARG